MQQLDLKCYKIALPSFFNWRKIFSKNVFRKWQKEPYAIIEPIYFSLPTLKIKKKCKYLQRCYFFYLWIMEILYFYFCEMSKGQIFIK